MKYLKYLFLGLSLTFMLQSCGDDDTENIATETTTETSSEETSTEVILTIATSEGEKKSGYTVLMFNRVFDPETTTPSDAVKSVKSDSNGIAKFNLEKEGAGTYYFEAFTIKSDGTYVLESKYRTELELKENQSSKTTILVKS